MDRKKQSLVIKSAEFALITALLVIPPLFALPSAGNSGFTPVSLLFFLVIQLLLLAAAGKMLFIKGKKAAEYISLSIFTWAALIVCMFIIKTASGYTDYGEQQSSGKISLFIAGVFFSAFYEESLYRWYLPLTLAFFLEKAEILHKAVYTVCRFGTELLPVCFFALAHRYLGWPAFINAFFAGLLLRNLVKKTGSLLPAGAVHFCYNMTIYFLMNRL